jgi:hypothetical protein
MELFNKMEEDRSIMIGGKKCSSEQTVGGDDLRETLKAGSLVLFAYPHGEEWECYDYHEIKEWFDRGQEKLFYWTDKDKSTRRVYKMMYSGLWVDSAVRDMVILDKFSTIYLYKKHDHAIGSTIGVSQTHGEVYPIYTGIPISRDSLLNIEGLRNVLSKTSPEKDILNPTKVERSTESNHSSNLTGQQTGFPSGNTFSNGTFIVNSQESLAPFGRSGMLANFAVQELNDNGINESDVEKIIFNIPISILMNLTELFPNLTYIIADKTKINTVDINIDMLPKLVSISLKDTPFSRSYYPSNNKTDMIYDPQTQTLHRV